MRDWKIRHQYARMEYTGVEDASKGKVWKTTGFLKYRMYILFSQVAQMALTASTRKQADLRKQFE